jgi:transposase
MSESLCIDSPLRGLAMPKAYSGDLRERVIEAVETGASRREAAERFEVSVASAVKWLQRWRKKRSAAPEPRGGSISPLDEFAVEVLALIAEQRWLQSCASGGSKPAAARSGGFSTDTTSPLKKSLQAAERQRADVVRARRRWIREQGMLDPARLVFIDETAVSTNMVRLKGRAPRGVRVIGAVPLGAWQTITFVAALRHNKMTAPMVIEGAMNGEMFLAYVEQCLVPTLRRNDIVVMDNCRVHLVAGVREAIEKARATVRYLPKYSPDLNPIEMSYSKFKTLMRKVAARTVPALNRAIRSFIPQLSPQECANYFSHAGYASI